MLGSSATKWWWRAQLVLFLAALIAILWVRIAIVRAWHVPAGDGHHYYTLSQELLREQRYAFGPPPHPLTYTRVPGYSLFLAYVAIRERVNIETHLVRATLTNVALDFGTATIVYLLLGELRFRRRIRALGTLITLTCPLLVRLSCFGLSETLATFLDSLELLFAIVAMRRRPVLFAAIAGAVAGFAQLVRADALTMIPGVIAAFALWRAPVRQRAAALGTFALCALATFGPWPLRNLVQFGAPHIEGHQWPAQDGGTPPLGPIRWMRTWSASVAGEGYPAYLMVNNLPLDPRRPGVLPPTMYDSLEERARLAELFERYNKTRLSPDVDHAFDALAAERTRRNPLRTFVTLPLRRIAELWKPVVEYELPMRIAWLGQPKHHKELARWDYALYALLPLGVLELLRRRSGGSTTPILGALLVVVVVRCLLFAWAIPHSVTQRYLAEAFPLLIVLATCGLVLLVQFALGTLAAVGLNLRLHRL